MPMETEGHGREFGRRQKMRAKCTVEFVCKYCQRRFTKPYNLMIHERSHKDDVTFTCEVCGKTFKRQDNLKQHRYTVTFSFLPFLLTLFYSTVFVTFNFFLLRFICRSRTSIFARSHGTRTWSDPWSIAAISEYSLGGPLQGSCTSMASRIWKRSPWHTWRSRILPMFLWNIAATDRESDVSAWLLLARTCTRKAIEKPSGDVLLRVLVVCHTTRWDDGKWLVLSQQSAREIELDWN